VNRTVLVVLIGSKETGQVDSYQLLQEQTARSEGPRLGLAVEVVFSPGFDHVRVIRKRLADEDAPKVDAVIVEPTSVSSTDHLLKELKGRTGVVLLNAWSLAVEAASRDWDSDIPFGTVSTNHSRIGEIQGRQVAALLPDGGQVLCVTGPLRSSAAVERLQGLRSLLHPAITVFESEAGHWTQSAATVAFDSWYALRKAQSFVLDVVAAQSDDLAIGARSAAHAVANAAHRDMLSRVRFLGVDGCPAFGRKLVDAGELFASVATPASVGEALRALQTFWKAGRAMPLRTFTEPQPYPPASAPTPRT
jgi:ABC-type sugar transport system substrate-binding protein